MRTIFRTFYILFIATISLLLHGDFFGWKNKK